MTSIKVDDMRDTWRADRDRWRPVPPPETSPLKVGRVDRHDISLAAKEKWVLNTLAQQRRPKSGSESAVLKIKKQKDFPYLLIHHFFIFLFLFQGLSNFKCLA